MIDYKTLPTLPGVYIFKNNENEIIYIGKAKNLKDRVSSYFANKTDWKVKALIEEATHLEHIITKTEIEALLLEAQLIQQHKPKFNVLLKAGTPFLYLVITDTAVPELKIVRTKREKGKYYGPFIHKSQARSIHTFLINTFNLFQCNKKIPNGCLDYHIGRCIGTCMSSEKTDEYLFRIGLVKSLLQKNHAAFIHSLEEKITYHIKTFEFEKARNLQKYKDDSEIIFKTLEARFSPDKYIHSIISAVASVHIPKEYEETAELLQNMFHLGTAPRTIDCFDISHFQSRDIVGSCIRFTDGKPDKNNFRRFKIKTLLEQNDYAALQEIVSRRYRESENVPDLIMIDGGKGQRNAVKHILPVGKCISLAKEEETIFSDFHPEGIKLDLHTPVGKLLIALRDYTHHFAITYNRTLRHKHVRNEYENK